MYPNLRAEMARKGVTNGNLCEVLNKKHTAVSQKLNGKYSFTFDEAEKIKEYLGVDMPLDELFKKEA